jgi:hypothetical protein
LVLLQERFGYCMFPSSGVTAPNILKAVTD